MPAINIPLRRLRSQRISHGQFDTPSQVTAWFGAMQAQDYNSAKWAAGLRCDLATDALVEKALAEKTIARTWLMRGTIQLVANSDLRWMLYLLAPQVIFSSARRYMQLELDEATFSGSFEIFGKALQGGKPAARAELLAALEEAGISTSGQRGYHILRRAGLEGVICFGPNQGNQQTFVLLDEWAPASKIIARDEALAELARRYFESRGPATLQDFRWWSGIPAADARAGFEMMKPQLTHEAVAGETYLFDPDSTVSWDPSPSVCLLPAYDEYYLGYKARDAVLDPKYDKGAVSSAGVFRPLIVIDGQIVGVWNRTVKKEAVAIDLSPFRSLTGAENEALLAAADRYGAFLGVTAVHVKLGPG